MYDMDMGCSLKGSSTASTKCSGVVCTHASGRISEKTLTISFPVKITFTHFTWKMIRVNFGGQNLKWWDVFFSMELKELIAGKYSKTVAM
jgi:hypothetical protein